MKHQLNASLTFLALLGVVANGKRGTCRAFWFFFLCVVGKGAVLEIVRHGNFN